MNKKFLFIIFLLFCIRADSAVTFSAASSRYLNNSSANLGVNGGTELTACAWIDMTNLSSTQFVVSKVSDSTNNWSTFYLQVTSGNGIGFSVHNQSLNQFPFFGSANSVVGTGVHLICGAWKRNAATSADVVLYYDGSSTATSSYTANGYTASFVLEENSNRYSIGVRNYATPTGYFDNTIKEVAVWSKQLTANEISLYYSARMRYMPLMIQPTSLVSYYPLDMCGDGVTCTNSFIDRSSKNITLTPVNSPVGQAETYLTYP
jgi:hypothetical protein